MIDGSGARRPHSLPHDAAEAIVVGLWAVVEIGWLPRVPAEVRRADGRCASQRQKGGDPDDDLRLLAKQRAQAVRDALVTTGLAENDRGFVLTAALPKPGEEAGAPGVEFHLR